MNLAERILHSRFINESSIDNSSNNAASFYIVGLVGGVSLALLGNTLDQDTANQIITLPYFMPGRMFNAAEAYTVSAFLSLLPKRGHSIAVGFLAGTIAEGASYINPDFFRDNNLGTGTADFGDVVAYGLGSMGWGSIDYLKARGIERFQQFRKRLHFTL